MSDRRHPADEPAMSQADRAELEWQRVTGQPIDGPPAPPSPSRFGRVLDALAAVARALDGGRG